MGYAGLRSVADQEKVALRTDQMSVQKAKKPVRLVLQAFSSL